jgi:serine/threonine protein kinase
MRAEVETLLLAGEDIRNTFLESPPSAADLQPDHDDATFAGEGVQHAHQKAIIHRDLKPARG